MVLSIGAWLPILCSSGPVRLEVVRAPPAAHRASGRAVRGLLVSWAGAGAVVAAASVVYVGVTAAQVFSMATADDPAATAVADPPAYAVPPAPASPGSSAATAAAPLAAKPAPPATQPTTQPSHSTTRPTTGPTAQPTTQSATGTRASEPARTRSTRPVAPARRSAPAVPATSRQERLEIKHARWADRQLAALLRTVAPTSPVQQWFGGAAWTTPVADYHLTAHFGETSRLWATTHTGLDFAAPTGTPVRAATAGTVTSVGWAGAYGNKIEITHPDGTETWYAHLSRTDVRVGAQVATGAVIGAVGATGNVTGSHLHFEVRSDVGTALDPETVLGEHGVRP